VGGGCIFGLKISEKIYFPVVVSTADARESLQVEFRGRKYTVPTAFVFTLGMINKKKGSAIRRKR
jgi:hypothetical protein